MESESEVIPVQLHDYEWKEVVLGYMHAHFKPESLEMYHLSIAEGKSVEQAVYDAVRNDAVIDILIHMTTLADAATPESNPPTP